MWVLVAGILVLAFELIVGSFYLLWYGFGFIVSGAVGWAIGSDALILQCVVGLIIGFILMVLFRKRLLKKVMGKEIKDEFLLEEGEGTIKDDGLVEFRGTTWKYSAEKNEKFEIDEKVFVKPTKSNKVLVRKK